MSVTLDTLRNIGADVNRFTLTNDGTVRKQGLLHRFMSLFKSSNASAQNAQTLAAIRTAIQNDPRFFASEVQQRAGTLLDGLAGRTVSAARLRDVLTTLDGMSTPAMRFNKAMDITGAHLASRGVPEFAQGFFDSYVLLAKHTIGKNEPPEGFGKMDYGKKLDDFEARMSELIDLAGDQPGDRGVFGKVCVSMLQSFNKTGLKDQASCKAAVHELKANLDESRSIAQTFGAAAQRNAVETIIAIGKPLNANTLTRLVACGRALPKWGIDALNADSTVDDIHRSLFAFQKAVGSVDLTALNLEDDGNVAVAVQDIVIRSAIGSLSDAQMRNLLNAIESDACRNLHAFYAKYAMENQQAYNFISGITIIAEELKMLLGLPNPDELDVPNTYNPTAIPPSIAGKYAMDAMVTGSASHVISGLFTGFKSEDPDIEQIDAYHRKVKEMATASLCTNIASQISKNLQNTAGGVNAVGIGKKEMSFDKDLKRNMTVKLPDGITLSSANAAEARDVLTRFVTDDADARFDAADYKTKMKVLILMSSINQGIQAIVMSSCCESLNTEACLMPFFPIGGQGEETQEYTLAKDANGNITIHCTSMKNLKTMVVSATSTGKEPIQLADESYQCTEIAITFTPGNLDDLAGADWAKYDHNPVYAAERNKHSMTRFQDAAALVPEQFRFTGVVDAHIHYHLIDSAE